MPKSKPPIKKNLDPTVDNYFFSKKKNPKSGASATHLQNAARRKLQKDL